MDKAKANTAGLTGNDTVGLSKDNVAEHTILSMVGHTIVDVVRDDFGNDIWLAKGDAIEHSSRIIAGIKSIHTIGNDLVKE